MATEKINTFNEMKTIFVCNLDKKTTENELYKIVDGIAKNQISSVFIRREDNFDTAIAYINMANHEAAKTVISQLNGEKIKSTAVRMSWALTTPSKYHQNEANVFIKGIKRDVTQHALQQAFEQYGEILSCKLSLNEKDESNGFGYVNFVEVESMEKAIAACEELKGKIGEETFTILKYSKPQKTDKTNLYVGNIHNTITVDDFIKYFETFGPIAEINGKKTAAFYSVAKTGKNKGYVNFVNPQDAEKALTSPKVNVLGEGELVIAYYKTKMERKKELKQKGNEIKKIIQTEYKDFNVYVNTGKGVITMEEINSAMEGCGEIYSVKIRYKKDKTPDEVFYICMKNKEDKEKVVKRCEELGWISHNFKPRQNQQHKFNPYTMFPNVPLQMNNPMNYATAPFMMTIFNMLQSMSQSMQMNQFQNPQQDRRPRRQDAQKTNGVTKKPRRENKQGMRINERAQSIEVSKENVKQPVIQEQPQPPKDVVTDEMKNDLGDNLYDYIVETHQFDEEMTGRITGVLLESLEYHELRQKLLTNKEELNAIIMEIKINLDSM